MPFRALVTSLIARCESAFDRAIADGGSEDRASERAGGDFISTLIIDHGASPRNVEDRATARRSRD